MKPSQFNIVIPDASEDSAFLLNAWSRSLCQIPKADADALQTDGAVSPELTPILQRIGALTETPEKQREDVFQAFDAEKYNHSELTIVIPLTNKCNLMCSYCYQVIHGDFRGENAGRIPQWTTDGVDALVRFVDRQLSTDRYDRVRLRWYGGEPLLRQDLIARIGGAVSAVAEKRAKPFSSMAVTNGVLINEKVVDLLRNAGVDRLEISIDGPNCLVAEHCWDQARWAIEAYAWRFDGLGREARAEGAT